MAYIYKISNDVNDLVYIGQTKREDIMIRFKEHYYYAHTKDGKYRAFGKAINEIGFEHFKIEVLEECDQSMLNEREIYWISYYDSYNHGYNMTPGGQQGEQHTSEEKPVIMCDKKTKEQIKNFNSLGEGARYIIENNLSNTKNIKTIISAISQNLSKRRQSAYGFLWLYQNEEKEQKFIKGFYCKNCGKEISSKATYCNRCEQFHRHDKI